MIASLVVADRGFYTPLYEVAAILDPETLRTSLEYAATGRNFYFLNEPFFFGLIMFVAVGGAWGLLFGLLARAARLHGLVAVAAGAVYGVGVLVVMSAIVLPSTAGVLGSDALADIPTTIGWPIFLAQHLLYGIALGLWVFRRPQDVGGRPVVVARPPETGRAA